MKRFVLMMAMTLILLGTLSEGVNSYCRPWVEGQDPSTNYNGDHPWGGDNSGTGESSGTPRPVITSYFQTGIGPIDMVLRVVYSKYFITSPAARKTGRTVITTAPNTGTTTGTTSSSSTGTTKTGNE